MIIKTITCHDVYNYGASLQAYALQQYLVTCGHDVQIINYKPDYLNCTYNFWYVPVLSPWYSYTQKSKLLHFLYAVRYIRGNFGTWRRKMPFDTFTKKYLKCTKVYNNLVELCLDPPKADCYIAGSDQIWNTDMQNGYDPAFYLDFGPRTISRLSYAASFAVQQVPESQCGFIKSQLSKFCAISVREESGKDILDKLSLQSKVVCDPVFLLSQNEWKKFAGEHPVYSGKYILVYQLYNEHLSIPKLAFALSQKYGFPIISVNDHQKCKYADINVSNAGPVEFVNLIYHASFVLTDSFHGTSFASILNKEFYTFYNPDKSGITRITNLLNYLGLSERLNSDKEVYSISWDKINKAIEAYRNSGVRFLCDTICMIKF